MHFTRTTAVAWLIRLFFVPLVLVASQACHAEAQELVDRGVVIDQVQKALIVADYDALDELERKFRTERSRTSSGVWKLTIFYFGIEGAISRAKDEDGNFDRIEAKFAAWARRNPKSPAAYIALAKVENARAWAIRGTGYANKVKPEAWEGFYKHIDLEASILQTSKPFAAVDPEWYRLAVDIARHQKLSPDQFEALMGEAFRAEPLYYQTYFQAVEYLLPKWHGSLQAIQDFAWQATQRTKAQEGESLYARIYWYASAIEFKSNVFNDSYGSWLLMKAGFVDIMKRYPDAWNVNHYARFACLAQDKATFKELLPRVRADFVIPAWRSASLFEQCVDWSNGAAIIPNGPIRVPGDTIPPPPPAEPAAKRRPERAT